MSYFVLTHTVRLLTLALLGSRNFHLRGVDNVPRQGSLIIVSNHVGTVDPPLIGAWTPRPVWFMAKAELFRKRFLRWLVTAYHAFPVVRHSPDRKALRRAFGLLQRGEAVVLFPEGHRSDDARLHRAEPGAGFVARHSGATILALGITGTQQVLGRGQVLPRRAPVEMVFGRPFNLPESNRDGTVMDHQASADYLMMKIAELLPLEYRGEYRLPDKP